MSGLWLAPDDWQDGHIMGFGSAHSVSGETEPEDAGEQVRKIAEEVTGKAIPRPAKQRMGFL